MRLRQFDGNVAHSNDGDGLRVDNGPKPDGTTEVAVIDPRAVPANPGSRELANGIDRFSAWKNRGSGVCTRLLRLEMTNATLADNPIGVTLVNYDSVVRDSLIVGGSANRGTRAVRAGGGRGAAACPGPGRRTSRSAGSSSTTAATAPSGSTSRGSPPTASGRPAPSPTCASPPSRSTPATGPAGPASAQGSTGSTSRTGRSRRPGRRGRLPHGGVLDADGSVTGSPGHYVTVDNPFLVDGGCRLGEDWNAWVCRQSYSRLSVTANGSAGPAGITLTRVDGTATVLRGIGERGAANGHHATLPGRQSYALDFEGGTPRALNLVMTSFNPSDAGGGAARWVKLSIPSPHGTPKVTRYGQPYPSHFAGGTLQVTLRLANPSEQYTTVEVRG